MKKEDLILWLVLMGVVIAMLIYITTMPLCVCNCPCDLPFNPEDFQLTNLTS